MSSATGRPTVSAAVLRERLSGLDPVARTGRVVRVAPTWIQADGPNVPLGELCEIAGRSDASPNLAEVVRIDGDSITLSVLQAGSPILAGAQVRAWARADQVPVGRSFLGRAVNAFGQPLDGMSLATANDLWPLQGRVPPPLERASKRSALETGIRAVDALLTLGAGQRVGIFAPSGAGKTSLLTQLVQQVKTDVIVLCLVGERGQEVQSIWSNSLSPEARQRTVLVAATSDQPAAMRIRAVHFALAQAEFWRAQGKHVLFLLDSATRLAMAMRETGLASGEPPTVRGYTPSVFAALPRVVERCGALSNGGAITGILTVLSEDAEMDDPICELLKSLLDGHILLARSLAEKGQFPAIDILRSVSRGAEGLIPPAQLEQVRKVSQWLQAQENSRMLVEAGLYKRGASATIDEALDRHEELLTFLKQAPDERSDNATTWRQLKAICERGRAI